MSEYQGRYERSKALTELHRRGAHLIACRENKKPIGDDWQKKRHSLDAVLKAKHVGLIAGSLGLSVVDVDVHDAESPEQAAELAGERIAKVQAWAGHTPCIDPTPSEGAHLFYKADDPERHKENVPGILEAKLEVFGTTGQVILYNPGEVLRHLDSLPTFAGKMPEKASTAPYAATSQSRIGFKAHLQALTDAKPGGIHNAIVRAVASALNRAGGDTEHPDIEAVWEVYATVSTDEDPRAKFNKLVDEAAAKLDFTNRAPSFGDAVEAFKGGEDVSVRAASIRSQLEIAEKFRKLTGDRFCRDTRRSANAGGWCEWDEGTTHWERLKMPPENTVAEVIHKVCQQDNEKRRLDTGSNRSGILRLVAEQSIRTDWDTQSNLIGLPKGLVADLDTGEVRAQCKDDYITRSTRCLPKDDAGEWPEIVKYLGLDDPTWEDFVATIAVDCAVGELGDHIIAIALGNPGTGKDTIFTGVQRALGDYAAVVEAENLLAKDFSGHPTWLADLAEKRMALTSELPRGASFNAPLLSRMTGGGEITARFMRQDQFTFEPQFRPVILCNDPPEIPRTGSAGLGRRIRVIPFDRELVGAGLNVEIARYYHGEGRGHVLRWILDKATEVSQRDRNLRYPVCERIVATTDKLIGYKTPFRVWYESRVIHDPDAPGVSTNTLYADFVASMLKAEKTPMDQRHFSMELSKVMPREKKGRPGGKGSRERGWLKVRLGATTVEQSDSDGFESI